MARKSLHAYVIGQLDERIAEMKRNLERTERTRGVLKALQSTQFSFEVRLTSMWEGEQHVVLPQVHGSLRGPIREAEDQFKKANSRADVQADYLVTAFAPGLPESARVLVPKEYWERFKTPRK